jgi:cytoskeletal protein RodZ
LTELGNRLKEARLASGLSLEDLQDVTKIQKRYLVGIEQGDFSAMPGNFYVRAFIKQYAEAVHLDAEEIFETFKAEIPSALNEHLPEQLSRVKTHKTITDRNPKVFDLLPKILIAVFVIGAAALIYYFLTNHAADGTKESENKQNETVNISTSDELKKAQETKKGKKKQDTEKEEKSETSKEPEVPVQELAVLQKSGTRTTFQLKNTDKFVVKLVSNGQSWVSIKNDKGHSFYQGMLNKDATNTQIVDLSAESVAVLRIGKATETDIFVNDQKLEYALPPTEVVTQNITIQFVPKNK